MNHPAASPSSPLAGLADPGQERDACGIGFVAHVDGAARRDIVAMGLQGLAGVTHRGAVAADGKTGDGAGILTQIPRALAAAWLAEQGLTDVADDRLGVAFLFLAPGADAQATVGRRAVRAHVEAACAAEEVRFLAWREVPSEPAAIGSIAHASQPHLVQAWFERPHDPATGAPLDDVAAERLAYRLRRRARHACDGDGLRFYAASCSFLTVTYKAMADADQLADFYPDLRDERFTSGLAVFHSRFSTNTAPTWERAQPFRMLCHNGEINTIDGNVNLMRAREGQLTTGALSVDGTDWADPVLLPPVIDEDQSDSAKLDAALELLVRGGRDLRHAQAMLVPQVWEGRRDLDPGVRDFYRYHSCLVEPWDGPAGLIFTDGRRVGATLDRNGLRPLRYHVCEDGTVVAASEVGAVRTSLPAQHGQIRRERLGPGQMLCVDPDEGGLQEDAEIKQRLADTAPYGAWLAANLRPVHAGHPVGSAPRDLRQRQLAYGVTKEEVTSILRPMATQGKEATSSMGDDTPIEPLAHVIRPVAHLLKQRFAQVTNPPIDHHRENEVMSLRTLLGPRQPLLTQRPEAARLLELGSYVLFPEGLQRLVLDPDIPFGVQAVDATFPVADGPSGLVSALDRVGDEAVAHVRAGAGVVVVSDVGADGERCRVPALLAVGAVHQRLVRDGLRTATSIVAETDEARETHDMAALLGFGADAIVPRLVLQTITDLADEGRIGGDNPSAGEAQERYRRAIEDGVLKIMSKMGISSLDSYRSAQIFESLGLGAEVVERCFTKITSTLGGLTFDDIAEDLLGQHAVAFPGGGASDEEGADGADEAAFDERGEEQFGDLLPDLPSPGIIKWKRGGEFHDMNKPVIDALHDTLGLGRRPSTDPFVLDDLPAYEQAERAAHVLNAATTQGRFELYERFAQLVNDRPAVMPRDLLEFHAGGPAAPGDGAVPLEEVESALAITARFSTGAMSHGALSAEAHETLAAAMNLVGARANCGEGGEAPERFATRGTALDLDCRIKQVASGRFGVTPQYLANAHVLQIKMAQGSKPGEGGQIPGHKVTDEIARLRHTTPGVTLISPPPHHDIYSIEDLAQLIFDLKQVNPEAEVDVKLVAEGGIGTVAAGVVKALADSIHISGNDGGTGASALSSIHHAGMPWELGLAEVQQTLRANGLRGRVKLRVDGGFKTGRDVLVAALLGADEYAFGTAALLAEGCILARACHRDTCPVGIATQRRDLRDRFVGTPEQVAAYLLFVAEEVRRLLASLGLRSLDDAVGRVDLLRPRRDLPGRAGRLDVTPLLADPGTGERRFVARLAIQDPRSTLGDRVFDDALETVFLGGLVEYRYRIDNVDRTVGARLGGAIGLEFGGRPPPGVARLRFEGAAGQSFGAFAAHGTELVLDGEANDYVGKGLGGGRIVIRPPADDAGDPVLVGNTVLYGATAGELFVAGRAGERFAVRNSGATAVIEGTGDHACEYMTGGTVVILGRTGHNVGAGMSGGELFVYDRAGDVLARVNRQLVEARRPDGPQLARLQDLVATHATITGSDRARAMLADWSNAAEGFWRVAPKTELDRVGVGEAVENVG
ncbi:glutamate synthase-related protein [Nitriliruptor alkaliphilus]|uniref:glutamate synthase-related protein n=1 Tax=Nitriliruptor alkaliphilus TaxID=427918 RepID=UPI0006966338|nr:glutamate synthase-related protein [Nitriliruptor alkaliphilus]